MAEVFDENKRGFMVGVGLGVTSISTETDYHTGLSFDERNAGVSTSFKLGYGFDEQLSIYYTNQVDWFNYRNIGTLAGLTGVGSDYYINTNSGLYVTGMFGIGTISDVDNRVVDSGLAFGVGVGHDLLPHMRVEINYMHINIEDSNLDVNTDSLRVTFQYTWY
jgi:hypothetical protein